MCYLVWFGTEVAEHFSSHISQLPQRMRSAFPFGRRFFLIVSTILLITAGLVFFATYEFDRWTSEIVRTNTDLTKTTVHKISIASEHVLDSLSRAGFFNKRSLTKDETHTLDHILASLVAPQAESIVGMEGGFYLDNVDELIGYSWPSSPPPPPAYGPAPRSFGIIRDQLIQTVRLSQPLVEFHQFDFATFPLATEPLRVGETTVGAVWARIHVEREVPSSLLSRWLNYAILISLPALLIVFLMTLRMRTRVAEIRRGLDRLQTDPTFRLPEGRGVFGAIASSINAMVETRARDQQQREQLERDLHQQDKMAMLGKLVAGVAHEVKTPLAIIKTRIQLWHQDLRTLGPKVEAASILSEDSIQLVLKEINRLSGLLKRLLVFSKPVGIKRKSVDINRLIEQVTSFVQTDADDRHVTIVLHLTKGLPSILIDPQALEQVFLNICSNAMDAMTAGGTIEVQSSLDTPTGDIHIIIRDTGQGIPLEIRGKIFDPFFTADHPRT
jgi:two-component system sensor histidine kinase HydH